MNQDLIRFVQFDESDTNLFLVDDPQLRADALKHSILPRLTYLLHHCIGLIRDIYGVEVLEHSIVTRTPNFRTKRDAPVKILYEAAFVGLGGQRQKEKWVGLPRENRIGQIAPFRYDLGLEKNGLAIRLWNRWLAATPEWHEKTYKFLAQYDSLIMRLANYAELRAVYNFTEDGPILTTSRIFENLLEIGQYDYTFVSPFTPVRVNLERLHSLCKSFAFFYPVYHSFIRLALGQEPDFPEMTSRLNQWIVWEEPKYDEKYANSDAEHASDSEGILHTAREAAETRTRVMPALRWQVFQRDKWRCVACGRGSAEEVILHVDHIVPRSKGGKDSLDNLQTLCHECNLGKSNKDQTDLRQS